MRHQALSVAIAVLSLPFLAGGAQTQDPEPTDHDRNRVFRAELSGFNEVPALSSTAKGTTRLTISRDRTSIHYRVSYEGFTETNPVVVAHVHFGPNHVNGGVMFFFCTNQAPPAGVPPPQACPTTEGTITGTVTMADVVGPASQGIRPMEFAKVVRAIEENRAYANVHSATFGAGEIRGQLK
jgi:CHRD domain